MLGVYKSLFESLARERVSYCVYKGLSHLDEDLNGDRGDLDLIVAGGDIEKFHDLARGAGFCCASVGEPFYYVALDKATHKFVMLDVCTKINFGPKPLKPYWLDLDFCALKVDQGGVNILSAQDYYPLMFYIRVASLSEKLESLEELRCGARRCDGADGYIAGLVEQRLGIAWKEILRDISIAPDWKSIREKYKAIVVLSAGARQSFIMAKILMYLFKVLGKVKRCLSFPGYRVRRKGHLVAFVGVDGAGKTSTISYLMGLEYFQNTGVKRIYFGNNEYKLPGLNRMLNVEWKSFPVRVFFSTLGLIDRQLRVLIAQYYVMTGNIVLADRYYYDDQIGCFQQAKEKAKVPALKVIYRKIFGVKMLKTPELTVFLDVSSEVAYARKQDYSYDIMLEQNLLYKEFMYRQPNVLVVDADAEQRVVYQQVVEAIMDLDDKKC